MAINLYDGLLSRFLFAKPVTITKTQTTTIVSLPDKTIIQVDPESLKNDIVRLIAHARLSEDNPLFSTYYNEALYDDDDRVRMRQFNRLRLPLSEAWSFGVMRR